MRFLQNDDAPCEKREFCLFVVTTLLIWLKFLAVDCKIADVLDWPTVTFAGIETIGHIFRALAVSLPSLGAILCLVIPVSLLPRSVRAAALIILNFMLSVLAVTDMLFIRYYTDIFIFHDIMLIPQTGLIVKSIWSLLKPWDTFFFADIALFFFLRKKKNISLHPCSVTRKRVLLSSAIFALSVLIQLGALFMLKEARPKIMSAMYDRLSVCAWLGSASFHWGDVITLAAGSMKSDKVPQKTIDELRGWFSAHNEAHSGMAAAKGLNLIIVQCEALQYFVVDLKINGVEITPNLNRFKRECLYFRNAWDQTAGGLSSDAEFMANTGLFPASSGAAYTRFPNNDYNSIARVLRQRGYHAVVVQGTHSSFWNCHRMHPKLKFEKQYSRNTFKDDEIIGLGLSDKAIFTEALEIFARFKPPFYGFIVTLSGHHPYDFEGLDDGSLVLPHEVRESAVGKYLIAMHYFDRQFGMFTEGLKKRGLLDKSLIVLYGDHPALPIAYKDEMEIMLGGDLDDPVNWKKTRRVPLMFRLPQSKGLMGESPVDTGIMDVAPTIAGLMGFKFKTAFGQNLLYDKDLQPVIFRNGSYMYKGVFVEPGTERATSVESGESLSFASFAKITDEVERRLRYSDLILEKNLIESILKK